MTTVELCRLVARAEFRPFTKQDYYGWAGVSEEGPHEMAEVDQYIVVRDGDVVAVHCPATEVTEVDMVWLLRSDQP